MKRAENENLGMQTIIVLTITLVSVLLFLLFIKNFRESATGTSDYTICKESNLGNAKLKIKIGNMPFSERSGNNCKTEYVKAPKGQELTFIAQKMANCWDMYLEGKEELFETKDGNYCAVCSVIDFEDKQKPVTGLPYYLLSTKLPSKDTTYYEYLSATTVKNDIRTTLQNTELNQKHLIDTTIPVAVMFTTAKDVYPGSLTGESSVYTGVIGSSAGVITGTLAGTLLVAGIGLCGTIVGCVKGIFLIGLSTGVIGGLGGGSLGMAIGSNNNPDLDTKLLLIPYTKEDLSKLQCTRLEGRDYLEIKK